MYSPVIDDWDDAYANMAHVPGSDALPGLWSEAAAAFRARARVERLETGSHPREVCDLVLPEDPPRGLAVFVHGGYWMRTEPAMWTHLAEGAAARGWAVALPGYVLAPEARLTAIAEQVARGIAVAAARVGGPIRLAGHSAGGHLVTRLVCTDSPLDLGVAERVEHVLSISGLHDLRPLMQTEMNATLHLDEAEASAESPALLRPMEGTRLTAWVGGGERPEFLRQTRLIDAIWPGLLALTRAVVDGDHHHFSVIEGLTEAESAITEAFVGDVAV
ncbi:alpha/beta hydrolase [Jannaschia marina]|uniref:alpha/beta hydrolase n=1 Tax=Jannaschia marina TaxID=2741674 RepID=UPI0015CA40BE|nr:alpha/beta hydrolase [Jannaschia marina]